LPVSDDRLANVVDIRSAAPEQFTSLLSHLLDEVLSALPVKDAEDVGDLLLGNTVKDRLDVALWVRNTLSSDHSLEDLISLRLARIVDDTWAVNQVDALR